MIIPITLEAMHILDAIDRRGSFSAAAEELNRAPSSLSYQIQKLEQELDLIIFDRSGHRAQLTAAGKLLLEQGRVILAATTDMLKDANALANGWELDVTIAMDGIIPVRHFFPLVDKLAEKSKTCIKFQEEILAGGWEALMSDRVDILITPQLDGLLPELKHERIGSLEMMWVAAPSHYVHKRSGAGSEDASGGFDQEAQSHYRVIAIADSARSKPAKSVNVFDKQARFTVSNFATKVEALEAGLGIGTMPAHIAREKIAQGRLKQIEGSDILPIDLVMVWKRNQMGKAKTWLIRNLPKCWPFK